ncbi:low molecular weight protein-tyrosine-phosphatase [Leucothrix arctica]|uniref:protein-tyrosine-phosphatase n=1 Tax=Leucothrix arctica TaxID=1481894 RepID=A0A317CAS4_9GAMM|nr:low molecular weight protein-tyrosine-phosphatase [Leucothrix arctica]PWQ95241.1 phosphotyrosine protein phosphatase [Leucothrix arctica]
MNKVNVLFVCMGNICRSPTAHGVFEALVEQYNLSDKISVGSAGTHAYHVGEAPDERSQAVALTRGYDLSTQQSRLITKQDFEAFDYILAMDKANLYSLSKVSPVQDRVFSLMDFAPERDESEVPDPYYGGDRGFENVLTMIEVASQGLLNHILKSNPNLSH